MIHSCVIDMPHLRRRGANFIDNSKNTACHHDIPETPPDDSKNPYKAQRMSRPKIPTMTLDALRNELQSIIPTYTPELLFDVSDFSPGTQDDNNSDQQPQSNERWEDGWPTDPVIVHQAALDEIQSAPKPHNPLPVLKHSKGLDPATQTEWVFDGQARLRLSLNPDWQSHPPSQKFCGLIRHFATFELFT